MFLTACDVRPATPDGNTALTLFLGAPQDQTVPRNRRLWFPTVTRAAYEAVCAMPPSRLADGVTLVIGREAYGRDPVWIDRIQKRLAWQYLKYVYLPRTSPSVPDPLGLRPPGAAPMLLYRELALARNHPLHLRWPLCRNLAGQGTDAPVAWLLPSPSLGQVVPLLPEIRRTCLIGCISLSLAFCLEHGVEPDFVLQLDTDFRYPHLLRPGRRLPNTWLVSHSGANIADAAPDYAGVFFMESFNLHHLPDPWRLRESWTGCAIACLGLAECLGAPDVFLAGVDHSWTGQADTDVYAGAGLPPTPSATDGTAPPPVVSHRFGPDGQEANASFPMADCNGHQVWTRFNYFGIAAELEDVAREMGHDRGTRFHRLTDTGILDPAVFLPNGPAGLSRLPDLDRAALRRRIHAATRTPPTVRARDFATFLADRLGMVEDAACLARQAEMHGDSPEALVPLADSLRATSNLGRFFHLETGTAMAAGLTDGLRSWSTDLGRALGVARIYAALEAGQPLRVLTLVQETDAVLDALAGRHPQGVFEAQVVDVPYKAQDDTGIYDLYTLLRQPAVPILVGPELEREFDYVLRTVAPWRVVAARHLL